MSDARHLRYLTTDGEVLYGTDADEHSVTLARRDLTRTFTVPSDDPLLWKAPDCTMAAHKYGTRDCPPCNGTGVDESIPLRLVGVGSVLRYNDRLEDCCSEVLRLVTKVGRRPQKDRERFPSSAPPVSTQCASCGSWRVLLPHDIGPGRPWTVFRAVPPMHCNEMLKEKNQ